MQIVAILGDALIASLIGLSCRKFQENLKSTSGKAENQQALKKMECELVCMEGIMTLDFSDTQSPHPTIVEITPANGQKAFSMFAVET